MSQKKLPYRIERRVILDEKTLLKIAEVLKARPNRPDDSRVVIDVHWEQEWPDEKEITHGSDAPSGGCYVQVILWESNDYEPLTKKLTSITRNDEREPRKQIREHLVLD